MEKYLVNKNIASNIRNAKALLLLFSTICLALSSQIFVASFEGKSLGSVSIVQDILLLP